MICEHPDCTGNHRDNSKGNLCPRSREGLKESSRRWWTNHKDEEEVRRRHRERSVRHYYDRTRRPYVYAILINEAILKIGYSTCRYGGQIGRTKVAFIRRGFGTVLEARMIWHNRGDQGLEIYLLWRAGRIWPPLIKGKRHSEWFDVSGVRATIIVKNLRRWRDQAELPDEEEVA